MNKLEDIPAIAALTQAAFKNATHSSHTEQFMVNSLRKHGQLTISLVALEHNQLVGHVAISPVTISSGETGWYGLGPISVLPAKQGQGIGTLLMQAALDRLQQLGAQGCVVLGDPQYYGRFGFKAFQNFTSRMFHQNIFKSLHLMDLFLMGKWFTMRRLMRHNNSSKELFLFRSYRVLKCKIAFN